VSAEDAVSVSGDVIALAGLALNQITGSSIPQGAAAVIIGLMLIRFGLRLVRRSHDFLAGAWLLTSATPRRRDADGFTQLLQPRDEEALRTFLLAYPGVTAIREVLVKFVGPGQAWVIARLDIAGDLRGDHAKSLVRGIEPGLKHAPVPRCSQSGR
jgi:divalent metal cation (Fe/Co/Zn/Cd) transporter